MLIVLIFLINSVMKLTTTEIHASIQLPFRFFFDNKLNNLCNYLIANNYLC